MTTTRPATRPDLRLTTPRAHTPAGWITFGFHEDLDEAALIALAAMLELMGELHGLSRQEAFGLASLVVDLRITQVVNQVRGVHALLPHGAVAEWDDAGRQQGAAPLMRESVSEDMTPRNV